MINRPCSPLHPPTSLLSSSQPQPPYLTQHHRPSPSGYTRETSSSSRCLASSSPSSSPRMNASRFSPWTPTCELDGCRMRWFDGPLSPPPLDRLGSLGSLGFQLRGLCSWAAPTSSELPAPSCVQVRGLTASVEAHVSSRLRMGTFPVRLQPDPTPPGDQMPGSDEDGWRLDMEGRRLSIHQG
ncbi:hypothetical protein GMORB2_6151 [Geosmithia morbida]|uniref:Uncharacterized protein n=1 Tax=Geosmithia morbida TaxID=1094350 RepID=A0A9P4YV86_9HYPO|nr:uncharacterized protein GMORB2_6151 [Geosmithia morbida]KAF4123450.1 hypothetical protein GMORB2_6151 [Geosmithia morbida]